MSKPRIYLDNCCYGRPFDNQKDIKIQEETQAKMFIQALIKYGVLELVYSTITVKELSDSPFEDTSLSILEFIESNATFLIGELKNTAAISLTEEIMSTGIKLKDASHTACAIIANCDYLITTDKRLAKFQDPRIKILNPIEFLGIWRNL
ncbi:MAG: hypothetical protein FWG87_05065 [Defluviitaleaceae bacterium]|nr:hypothetical protein [Defluviitaleaceae bacterium]